MDNIYENTNDYAHETFVFPGFADKLVSDGKLGRKSGGGLYQLVRYDNGLKRQTVLDINSGLYRDVIAELTKGGCAPDGTQFGSPRRVIYQCSEDGIADTIKPRLLASGADCAMTAFLNEEKLGNITLDDERLRQAIIEFRPALLVVDPIQAYIGNCSDLQMAGKARKLTQRLGMWASMYDCAIVLIGHMNKREGQKNLYRGLGSIDLAAFTVSASEGLTTRLPSSSLS